MFSETRFLEKLAGFPGANEGSAALVAALAMPLVIGGAAFGVETSYWYYKDLRLQAAADAAAYAAALEERAGSGSETVTAAASAAATQDGYDPSGGTIAVHSPPLTGSHTQLSDNAVEVVLSETKRRYFSSLFDPAPVVIRARSVAQYQDSGSACILALHPTSSKAALFSGSSAARFVGCTVMANSIAADAVTAQGSASLEASCIFSGGGVSLNGSVTLDDCAGAKTGASPVSDPFKDLVEPSTSGSCNNGNGSTLQPGIYCNGLGLSGNRTLSAGTYVVMGGDLKINANANVSGTGVTIFLSGDARVSMNGNATVNLSAPTSGSYSGVLFFGDRASTGGSKDTFNGTASSQLTGAIYFASQDVQYVGNFSGDGGCTQIVGLTVEWSGNATVAEDCSSHGMRKIPDTQLAKLVE